MAGLSILCVHGIGHGDADTTLVPSWTDALTTDIRRWSPQATVALQFLAYDDLFDHAPLNPLVNREDHVFTARIRLGAANFAEILTEFDKPDDWLNHDPLFYFNHQNTSRVWVDVSGGRPARALARSVRALRPLAVRPQRRALLIG